MVQTTPQQNKSVRHTVKQPRTSFLFSFPVLQKYWLLLLLLTLVVFVGRLLTVPAFAESRDSLLFVRGIERYATYELRPHWPGYPVYIWFGTLFKLFTSNSVEALHLLSIVVSTATIWPITAIARGWKLASGGTSFQANLAGLGAGLLWAVLPLPWLSGSEIYSDPLALFLGMVILWLSWCSLQAGVKPERYLLIASVVSGLLLGVRYSGFVLLLPFFYALWQTRKTSLPWRTRSFRVLPLLALLVLSGTIGAWLGWQWAMEGSNFIEAGRAILNGHYNEWGNSFNTDPNPLMRPVRFVETIVVHGLGGWWPGAPWWRVPVSVMLGSLLAIGAWHLACSPKRTSLLFAILWFVPYFTWVLLSHDLEFSRYGFPLVALACIVGGIGLPANRTVALTTLAGVVLVVSIVSVPLAFEHQNNPPLGQKLINYLKVNFEPEKTTVIITEDFGSLTFFMKDTAPKYRSLWLKYREVEIQARRVSAQAQAVYATFAPEKAPNNWVAVARFCRQRFLETSGPSEVWLYRYQTGVKPTKATTILNCSS